MWHYPGDFVWYVNLFDQHGNLKHLTSKRCQSTDHTLWIGYSTSELIAAVNQTSSIPPVSIAQLYQVIYRCEDIHGGIVGNSLCIDGCIPANNVTHDDQCQLSGGTTTTVTVTTAAPVSCFSDMPDILLRR